MHAYYAEAALSLCDHVPAARLAESWLHRATETGGALVAARDATRDAGHQRRAWFPYEPVGQPGG